MKILLFFGAHWFVKHPLLLYFVYMVNHVQDYLAEDLKILNNRAYQKYSYIF